MDASASAKMPRAVRFLLLSGAAVLGAAALSLSLSSPAHAAAGEQDASLTGGLGSTLEAVVDPLGDTLDGVVGGTVKPVVEKVVKPVVQHVAKPVSKPAPAAPAQPAKPSSQPAAKPVKTGQSPTSHRADGPAATALTDALRTAVAALTRTLGDEPTGTAVAPVADLVDGTLQVLGTDRLPVVGGVLGSTPVGSVTTPVTGLVDGILGTTVEVVEPGLEPLAPVASGAIAPAAAVLPDSVRHTTAPPPAELAVAAARDIAELGTAVLGARAAAGLPAPAGGAPLGVLGSDAGTLGMAAAAAAAAVALLARRDLLAALQGGRAQAHRDEVLPSSPVFETDSSPD
ncbi:hypothetical protein [Homoserinibacter sp. YIM 151385]|uniref:hypothetical protein n=1 Tax=Homoserinibacter sp. YIM 151385 TaxID=2985506 RepID=UPI0022EFF288|nr:hypothetical protein [Homoserinibacter sp. YIM 151385]WBU39095.1 hypothetical protein OF852_05830 [Homoserinibacter sp. YIM 151385]